MQDPTPNAPPAPVPSPALAAFLRGIERRAFVFARVQCGRDDQAEQALARAMHTFQTLSAMSPLSAWPAGFWSLLLAQGELSSGDSDVPELIHLGSGPRAALLLRIVSGLDFAHAAQVLGISEETYRFALQRALQQLGDAGVSYAALAGVRERLHRQVKTLPGETTDALAALRQRALTAAPEPPPPPPVATNPWLPRLLWALLALLALGFAATFIPRGPVLDPGHTEVLPAEPPAPPPPANRGEADTVSHPDYAQLAAPAEEKIAADLALLSWLSHQAEFAAVVAGPAATPAGPTDAAAAPPPAIPAATPGASPDPARFAALATEQRRLLAPLAEHWPTLDAGTRSRLLANADHWLSLDGPGRAALQARIHDWDNLPAPERSSRRAPFAAWQALPAAEQALLRALAAHLATLPAEAQKALRDAFEALPGEQRRDWWLGPGLGADFSGLQSLVAFVPDAELGPVLAMLRGLSAQSRGELSQLSRRVPPGERAKLRQALLAAPPENREALISERLAQ